MYIEMVSTPSKMFGKVSAFFTDNLVTLLLIIIVFVVSFCLYNYFNPVKENFTGGLSNILDSKSTGVIVVTEAQQELLKQSRGLIPAIKTVKDNQPRIAGLEGLCSNITEPRLLPPKSGTNADEGCGWYFIENPDTPSFSAYGNSYGPLNNTLKDIAKGGTWYFNNLEQAQQLEDLKLCSKIRTCQLADLYPGRCAWCENLGYGIPIDDYGASKYPNEDKTNCLGPLTKNVNKCTYAAKNQSYVLDANGNFIKGDEMPKPICNIGGGKLSTACLLFLAKAAGIKENSPIYSVISGDPEGYLIANTLNNRNFNAAFQIMNYRAGIVYDPTILVNGNCKRETALKYYKSLVNQTARGINPRTRKAALFLVNGTQFTPDLVDRNKKGPFDLQLLQSLFKEAGGQEEGTAYPTKDNIGLYNNGHKLGYIIDALNKTCGQDINSADINVQTDAVKKCLGINVQLPLAGCDLKPPPYIPVLAACNPGNVLIGNTTDSPTRGVEILWYSFDGDLTFPERRHQVATYYGRQIKLSLPSVAPKSDSIPFNTKMPLAFVARSNISYNGPIYNATYNVTASEGAAIKVASNIVLRNWKPNTSGAGKSNTFKLSPGDVNFTEIFWFSSNPSSSELLISMNDYTGKQVPIQAANCSLKVGKDFPVARWDFFAGSTTEINNVLSSTAGSGTSLGVYQNKPCMNFSGAGGVTIQNKIGGSAFRSFTAMMYYNGIGAQGSNRAFVLAKTNGSRTDDLAIYKASDSIEAGITNTGAVFVNLKPANGSNINLLSAITPQKTVNANSWFHMAVSISQDFSEIKIFINGNESAKITGSVNQAYYDNMIFDFASIGGGYTGNSTMALNGGIAWAHWFDYQLCADGISKDMNGNFCNTDVYPITASTGWPMSCPVKNLPVAAAAAQATGGNFIVVGGPAKLAYSQDGGRTYTVSSSGSNLFPAALNAQVSFVANNGSQWLAGGQSQSGAKLATSADGINWSNVSSMDNYGGTNSSFDYAIWNGEKWIMQCTNVLKSYTTEFFISFDGQKWNSMMMDLKASNISQIAMNENGKKLVMSGTNVNMTGHAIYYTTDRGSETFSASADRFFNGNGGLYTVAYGGGKFVAGGCGNAWGGPPIIIYSSDGSTWNQADISTITTGRIWNVYYINNKWFATTQAEIISSVDGINWVKCIIPSGLPYLSINKTALAKVGTGYIACLSNGALTSSDGNTWSIQPALGKLFYLGLNAVAVGSGSTSGMATDMATPSAVA